MKSETTIFLFRSWIIGSVVVIVHFLMHLQHFFIGFILGLVNTFFTDPYTKTIKIGNITESLTHKKMVLNSLLNILISVTISLIIRGIDFVLVTNNIVEMPIETFRFILFYQIIYYGFKYLYIFIVKKFKKKEIGENNE